MIVSLTDNNSYTFLSVSSNKSLDVTFKKDSILWPLLNIIWSRDSIYIDSWKWYEPGDEILNFSADGTYTSFWNNELYVRDGWMGWTLDRTKSPAVLKYGGRPCKLEKINIEKLIFSYINELNQKVTHVNSNHGYK